MVSAAFVTLVMIVVNTVMLSVRERRTEIGVLKGAGLLVDPDRPVLSTNDKDSHLL